MKFLPALVTPTLSMALLAVMASSQSIISSDEKTTSYAATSDCMDSPLLFLSQPETTKRRKHFAPFTLLTTNRTFVNERKFGVIARRLVDIVMITHLLIHVQLSVLRKTQI